VDRLLAFTGKSDELAATRRSILLAVLLYPTAAAAGLGAQEWAGGREVGGIGGRW